MICIVYTIYIWNYSIYRQTHSNRQTVLSVWLFGFFYMTTKLIAMTLHFSVLSENHTWIWPSFKRFSASFVWSFVHENISIEALKQSKVFCCLFLFSINKEHLILCQNLEKVTKNFYSIWRAIQSIKVPPWISSQLQ